MAERSKATMPNPVRFLGWLEPCGLIKALPLFAVKRANGSGEDCWGPTTLAEKGYTVPPYPSYEEWKQGKASQIVGKRI